MNRELAKQGLTAAQGHIIGYLFRTEQAPCARDLEEFFQLSHPTVSGLLSRMEAKGFIEFRTDETDRRIKRIYPLEKGKACHELIVSCIRGNEAQLVQDFSDDEVRLFRMLLNRAASNLCESTQQFENKQEE